jgi:hypothetical protein
MAIVGKKRYLTHLESRCNYGCKASARSLSYATLRHTPSHGPRVATFRDSQGSKDRRHTSFIRREKNVRDVWFFDFRDCYLVEQQQVER